MRTNIDLDEKLLLEFKRLSNSKTKREAVTKALQEAIQLYRKKLLLSLQGKVKWEGNLDEMRTYDPWTDK